jgi:hypothetical protein
MFLNLQMGKEVYTKSVMIMISGRSLLSYQFTNRVTELTVVVIVGHHCYQLHTKLYRIFFFQG